MTSLRFIRGTLSFIGASVMTIVLLVGDYRAHVPETPVRAEGAAGRPTAVTMSADRSTVAGPAETGPASDGQISGSTPVALPAQSEIDPALRPSIPRRPGAVLTELPGELAEAPRPNPFVPVVAPGLPPGPIGRQSAPLPVPAPTLPPPSRPTVPSFQTDFPLPSGFMAPGAPPPPSTARPSSGAPTNPPQRPPSSGGSAPSPLLSPPPPPLGAGMKVGAIVGRRDRIAIIEYAGQVFIVRVGDRAGGAVVAQILENRVVMRQGTATFELFL